MSQSFTLSRVCDSMPPTGIDFEFCAVQQKEVKTFMLSNPTSSLVQFSIAMDDTQD